MRQIAVLPYRFGGPAQDGPTEILLITSRETKRWVVPKGNPLNGMPRHAAAAVEAEEEAGVIGAVCPTTIRSHAYMKRWGQGASHMQNGRGAGWGRVCQDGCIWGGDDSLKKKKL